MSVAIWAEMDGDGSRKSCTFAATVVFFAAAPLRLIGLQRVEQYFIF